MLAGENLLENRIDFVLRNSCQEAQAAQIDGQDGNFALRRQPRGGKQCSVAAQHDQQVGAAGKFLALPRLSRERAETIARLGIADHLRAMCLQPIDQRRHDARDVLAPRTGNYSDSFESFWVLSNRFQSELYSSICRAVPFP